MGGMYGEEGLLHLGQEEDCVMDTNENGMCLCTCVRVWVCGCVAASLNAGADPQNKRHMVKMLVYPNCNTNIFSLVKCLRLLPL